MFYIRACFTEEHISQEGISCRRLCLTERYIILGQVLLMGMSYRRVILM